MPEVLLWLLAAAGIAAVAFAVHRCDRRTQAQRDDDRRDSNIW